MSELEAGPHQGGYDQDVPIACRAVDYMDVAFGQAWMTFKALDFANGTEDNILEAVGIYPNKDAAQQTFDRLIGQLRQCADLHADNYKFAVNQQDSRTVALCYEQCRTLYQVVGNAVIAVAANNFRDSPAVADRVLQTITNHI